MKTRIRTSRWSLLAITTTLLLAAVPGGSMSLTPEQQVQVLVEAQGDLDAAAKQEADQPVAARKSYARAAKKFQLLTETADGDGELYRRLADAQLHSGQIGAAIASYQRAEQLLGPAPRVRVGLATARRLRDHDEGAPVVPMMTFMEKLALWNRSLSVSWRFWGALAAWIGLWAALIASLWIRRRGVRISAAGFGLVFALLVGSLACEFLPGWDHTRGVVTASTATIRRGNGEAFPAQCAPVRDGTEFELIERRGRWLRVLLPDGNTGWLDSAKADLIPPRHTLWR